jgi:hypothetical protein
VTAYAWIKSQYLTGSRLVYHRATWNRERAGVEKDGVWRSRTDCGLIRHGEDSNYGVHLALEHASKIARPCRKCFPL